MLHYADDAAYERYLRWFDEHPIPAERGPAGRTRFKFYLVTDSTEVSRTAVAEVAAGAEVAADPSHRRGSADQPST